MINTNTDKPTQKPTATISESSIYLKKSELPQNVSSFKNDAGYISSSALSAWLKEHSYISKTEITSLINKANLVVVDTVNKSADSDAINRLKLIIEGEIAEIKTILENINKTYVSTESINSLATKTDIANLSDEIDTISTNLSNIDLSSIATKDEIPSIDGLAEKDWVESRGYITSSALSGYAKKSDIPTLNGYATQEWVNEQGFLTESQDLGGFAKKTELKDYVKTTSLSNTLNNYAKKNAVYTKNETDFKFLSKIDASDIYLTKTSAVDQFASKQMVESEYLKIGDYRGLKDATVINDDYKDKSLETLKGDLNKLMNGFYIVNNNTVVVKDHNVVNILSPVIEWKEE